MVAPLIPVTQSLLWLRSGVWPSVSLLDASVWIWSKLALGDSGGWLTHPESWIVVHKLVAWMPLSAASAALGVLLLMLSRLIPDGR